MGTKEQDWNKANVAYERRGEERDNPEASLAGTTVDHARDGNIQIGNKAPGHGPHDLREVRMPKSPPDHEGKRLIQEVTY